MKRAWLISLALISVSCGRHAAVPTLKAKAFASQVVLIGGEKQAAGVGAQLDQPVVVQANDAKGAAVAGALVHFSAAAGVEFHPQSGLAGADGQFTTSVNIGSIAGEYQIAAWTTDAAGKRAEVKITEIALGYQEKLGQQLNAVHCIRCHDPESTPERVSNHDNLNAKPHAFTDGAYLNAMSDAALAAIIGHGGVALNKSAEMPPYGNRFTRAEIDALVAYIRAVADPPYRPQGVFYASN